MIVIDVIIAMGLQLAFELAGLIAMGALIFVLALVFDSLP